MEGGLQELDVLEAQVGDSFAGDVGHALSQRDVHHQVAHHHVLPELGALPKVLVDVERVVVHGQHAEENVIGLGDGAAGPVLVDITHFELFQITAKTMPDRR